MKKIKIDHIEQERDYLCSNFPSSQKYVIPKDDTYKHEVTKKTSHFTLLSVCSILHFWVIMCLTYARKYLKELLTSLMRTKKATLQKYLAKKLLCNWNMSYYESDPGSFRKCWYYQVNREGAGGGGQGGREFLTYCNNWQQTRSENCQIQAMFSTQ